MRRPRLPLRLLLLALSLGCGLALLATPPAAAGEGQWLPEQLRGLDFEAFRRRGLELGPEDLWDGEKGLLSAAIDINGCSASFISSQGLIATNHHCGYRALNQLSTVERNYLAEGFTAGSLAEELPAPGYRVRIPRRMEDVTAVMQEAAAAAGDDPAARWEAVQRKRRELEQEASLDPSSDAIVVPFFEGREWRRIHRTTLPDVRLVYAPPESVGAYGGETDNWMWPRHTGDFTLFRAYAAPDGSPAPYSPENVPYRPERWLELAPEGVEPGDFVMILGYPGRTRRYLTSIAVAAKESWFYPTRLELYTGIVNDLRAAVAGNPEAELQAASRIKSLENQRKNASGMIWGLAKNRVVERKEQEEAAFLEWVQADDDRRQRYGDVLDRLMRLDLEEIEHQERDLFLDEMGRQSALLRQALGLERVLRRRLEAGETSALPVLRLPEGPLAEAEYAILGRLLRLGAGQDPRQGVAGFHDWLRRHRRRGEDWSAFARRLFAESLLSGGRTWPADAEEARDALEEDGLASLAALLGEARMRQGQRRAALAGKRLEVGPLWIQAQQEWRGGSFYPDANRTLRVSFASVKGYSPRDGVLHTPQTTVDGMLDKYTGEGEFDLPGALLEKARARDWGPWAAPALGSVPVCFLADGDTTGGNSGSPVVDGRGRLVGLNFDRVFEAVAGDFGWNPERSRNISMDVRFLLWMLDRVQPAPRLLEELGLSGG